MITHLQFCNDTFRSILEEYEAEGIEMEQLEQPDNLSCLDLLIGPRSIATLIDDEFTLGRDDRLMSRMIDTFRRHQNFEIPKQKVRRLLDEFDFRVTCHVTVCITIRMRLRLNTMLGQSRMKYLSLLKRTRYVLRNAGMFDALYCNVPFVRIR